MAKKVTEKMNLNGTTGMRAQVARLQVALDTLDDAAWYFECIGLQTQGDLINDAMDLTQDCQDLLSVFLGDMDQLGPFETAPEYDPYNPEWTPTKESQHPLVKKSPPISVELVRFQTGKTAEVRKKAQAARLESKAKPKPTKKPTKKAA